MRGVSAYNDSTGRYTVDANLLFLYVLINCHLNSIKAVFFL